MDGPPTLACPGGDPIRVLLLTDHWLVEFGVRRLLDSVGAVVTVFDVTRGDGSVVQDGSLDAVVLALALPNHHQLERLKRLHVLSPRLPILVVGVHSEYHFPRRAVNAGAVACFMRDSSADAFLATLEAVRDGTTTPAGRLGTGAAPQSRPRTGLSDREQQVLHHLASGRTVSEAAASLGLSVKTVSTYR
ncbi:MAG: LuxR C-terminal-related transcriptional regulator, partial [Acidobacteriota bacterium]